MTSYNQLTPSSENLPDPSSDNTLNPDVLTSESLPAAASANDTLTANKLTPETQPPKTLTQNNLTLVRKGLTAEPQNSYADFKICATSYGLEVQFSQDRLRTCPVFTAPKDTTDEPELSPLMIAATILLVGGSVVLTKSTIFGILVAIAIPVFWKLSTPSKGPAPSRTAKLRFVNTPKNQTFLSLTTAPLAKKVPPYGTQAQSTEAAKDPATTIHFSNLPVQLVAASTYLVGGQLSLTLYTSDTHGKNKLRITGTRQEIRWLHARIARWSQETLPHPIA
ncbi:MAG: hypothetical protein AB8B99_13575 [Phormidesmis sp.]